jgi:ornithine cyclodeaminase
MIPTYDESRIRAATNPAQAIASIREAFRADGLGRTTVPGVINLPIPGVDGEFHIKTAYIAGVPHIAVKVASGFYQNPSRGLPSGGGLMMLFDAATGVPMALMLDNGYLTDLRTAAAGAVAAEALSRHDSAIVGVIGSGVQARLQVRCLREVRPIRRVIAWSRDPTRLATYCAEVRALGLDARAAASIEEVCTEADLLVTTTPARAPLVRAAWLRRGMHVTAVGADSPGKQELDPACFSRDVVTVADRTSQCEAFGEIAHAIESGVLERARITQLGAIVAGVAQGRIHRDQVTIADLTGVGFQDTAIASEVYRNLLVA